MDNLKEWMSARLKSGITMKLFPGAAGGIIKGRETITAAEGYASIDDYRMPVTESHLYDIASLTKVVATLPAILLSFQYGKLALYDSAAKYLPELLAGETTGRKDQITIFHLLTHTSGLPGWRPYYITSEGKEGYLRAISQERLLHQPGEKVIYSDLGFILLGMILERIWDEPLETIVQKLIFKPLGMGDTGYLPSGEKLKRIVPTEIGNAIEAKMAHDYYSEERTERNFLVQKAASFHWRKGAIHGTVHDCNAHFGLNGVSGHAGVFSTLDDLLLFMKAWNRTENGFIQQALKDLSTNNHTINLGGNRGLGWDKPAESNAAGRKGLFSPRSFGHKGFTGTSIWCDPARGLTAITLTNRVHCNKPEPFLEWRREYHQQLLAKVPTREERSSI